MSKKPCFRQHFDIQHADAFTADAFIADDKYSLRKQENLTQPIQMLLSKK